MGGVKLGVYNCGGGADSTPRQVTIKTTSKIFFSNFYFLLKFNVFFSFFKGFTKTFLNCLLL